MSPRRWPIYLFATVLLSLTIATVAWFASDTGRRAYAEASNRSPQSLIRYTLRRLEGHETLQRLLLPALQSLQGRFERMPPPGPLPTLGKGQQKTSLAPAVDATGAVIRADTSTAIVEAMLRAEPGTRIVVAPGHYHFDQTLRLGHDGRAQAPIVMGALVPGSVRMDFSHEEGILVDRPHWTFENLNIRGTCPSQQACEHAFHVVGGGTFATLRNNHLQDFNAHIKVNGFNGQWPDHGLVAYNTLTNTSARHTHRPVVMLDLVGAHHWKVQDNLVTHFAKAQGNRVAYGLFMKGASEGGRIERNLVVCSPNGISDPGERVGISFGGGGTDPGVCRADGCRAFEHRQGWAANNIVVHCNDAGLDVNHAIQVALAHNTLINTAGFSIRGGSTQTRLLGNLFEGRISTVDSSAPHLEMNLETSTSGLFVGPDALLLDWVEFPEPLVSDRFVTNDFRNLPRQLATLPGALERGLPGN